MSYFIFINKICTQSPSKKVVYPKKVYLKSIIVNFSVLNSFNIIIHYYVEAICLLSTSTLLACPKEYKSYAIIHYIVFLFFLGGNNTVFVCDLVFSPSGKAVCLKRITSLPANLYFLKLNLWKINHFIFLAITFSFSLLVIVAYSNESLKGMVQFCSMFMFSIVHKITYLFEVFRCKLIYSYSYTHILI